jgi:type IV pilus assembly protein PilV
MSFRGRGSLARGFTLVEVMVGVFVIGIGLLGVAKIQALALSSTGTARMRSMVAFAAASLAATMRADRAYWAHVPTDPAVSVNVVSSVITAADPDLIVAPSSGCTAQSPCTTAAQVAAQDLHDWAGSLQTMLPAGSTPTATVSCQITAANPVTCAIYIAWTEHLVSTPYSTNIAATAQQTAAAVQQAEQTSYTLYAQP